MIRALASLLLISIVAGCRAPDEASPKNARQLRPEFELVLLGTAQDGGAPHLNCRKECCNRLRRLDQRIAAVSAAILDHRRDKLYLLDASPDLREQLDHPAIVEHVHAGRRPVDGIFLTHAHIGHYLGLAWLGRESLATRAIPVHGTASMCRLLTTQAPWSLLVESEHIELHELIPDQGVELAEDLKITPFLVPHREEFSDTVGFAIAGPRGTTIYLPDVDRVGDDLWQKLAAADVVLLDGTFFDDAELGGRDMSAIPHPRIRHILERYRQLPRGRRPELRFIHLNHTNPALDPDSPQSREVTSSGAAVARSGLCLPL